MKSISLIIQKKVIFQHIEYYLFIMIYSSMFIIQFSPRNIVYSGDFHYGLHELMRARLELEPPWGKRTLVTESLPQDVAQCGAP